MKLENYAYIYSSVYFTDNSTKYNHEKSVGCFRVIGLELSNGINLVVLSDAAAEFVKVS